MTKRLKFSRLILGIICIALAVLILLALIRFGSVFAFLMIYPWISDALQSSTGMSHWMASLIAFVPAVVGVIGIGMLFSWNRKKRTIGLIMASVAYLVTCGFMYSIEADRSFDPLTGKANKCFAAGLDGYEEISCEWKFHPETGNPVITDPAQIKNIITAMNVSESEPRVTNRVRPNKNLRFFSVDGRPLYWYYQFPDGKIDLFDSPGRHPHFGKDIILQPITAEIVKILLYPQDDWDIERVNLPDSKPISQGDPKALSSTNNGNDSAMEVLRDLYIERKKQLKQ